MLLAHTSLADFERTIDECERAEITFEVIDYADLYFRDFYQKCLDPDIFPGGCGKYWYVDGDQYVERVWALLFSRNRRSSRP